MPAGADIAAAILAGLGGWTAGKQQQDAQKRQAALDAQKAEQQALDNRLRIGQLDLQRRKFEKEADDDLRVDYRTRLGEMPAGADLAQAGIDVNEMQRLGLGHRVDKDGYQYADPLNLAGAGLPSPLPSMTASPSLTETPAQTEAREAGANAKRQRWHNTQQRDALLAGVPNKSVSTAIKLSDFTGKAPTINPGDIEDPFTSWFERKKVDQDHDVKMAGIRHGHDKDLERQRQAGRRDSAALTPTAGLNATMRLRDSFTRETKASAELDRQVGLMRASLQAVREGRVAAGSQGVLVTFQKILDPTSVVRESEYARSASGLSALSQLEGQFERIKNGGAGVPLHELEHFVATAEQLARGQQSTARTTREQIDSIATSYGLDPAHITREFGDGDDEGVSAPPSRSQRPSAQGPQEGARRRMKTGGVAEYRNGQWVRVE